MPRPVYIIPAQFVIEEKSTNLVSMICVNERFEVDLRAAESREQLHEAIKDNFKKTGKLQEEFGAARIHVVAVWMKESGDEMCKFEHEFALAVPASEEIVLGPNEFEFDPTKPFRRFKAIMVGLPPINDSCILEIESRVRRVSEGDKDSVWVRQSYPLTVDVVHKPQSSEES